MTAEIKAQIIEGDTKGIEYSYTVKEYTDYLLAHTDEIKTEVFQVQSQ